jgi:hypothetical protein
MGVSVGMAQITTSLYAVHLGASATLLGMIAGAQSLGVIFASLPVGVLIDRFGPTRPFLTGTVLVGAVYAILPLGGSALWLLSCTAFVSFAMPLRFVSLNTVFLEQLASIGEARAGWYRGTHMLGMFLIGPLAGAALVSAFGFASTYRMITEGSDGRIFEVTAEHETVWEYVSPYWRKPPLNLNLEYRAYRYPYDWVPQLERPHEVIVPRLDVKTFRVPGAAPTGRHRTVELRNISSAPLEEGALCVAAETPIPLSAGG